MNNAPSTWKTNLILWAAWPLRMNMHVVYQCMTLRSHFFTVCLERTSELFLSSVGHIQSGSKANKPCCNVIGEAFINYLFNEFLAMNTVGLSPF